MKLYPCYSVLIMMLFVLMSCNKKELPKNSDVSPEHTIATYYFPNYHPTDPRNEKVHGKGWSEWELVKKARPRFEGHRQPRVPAWGYENEANPKAMEKKIRAAANHGIDTFIFDWYYYNDGKFLHKALENGFFNASNNNRMKFALMWANHDWLDIHPYKLNTEVKTLYPGMVTPETFDELTDYVVENYFSKDNYWKIDGKPYFSIYELFKLVKSFESIEATRNALNRFRSKTKEAGFPGLHLNAVSWGVQILPGEEKIENERELIDSLGFDSVTDYIWIHDVPLDSFPTVEYSRVREQIVDVWKQSVGKYGVPYYPNVTMGWDSSPRTVQSTEFKNAGYPYTPVVTGNTPAEFKKSLRQVRQFVDQHGDSDDQKIITINAWNEWTEGSYLEPDTTYGMGYLEAIKDVFGEE